MKRIILYHDDIDGRAAGAIAGRDAIRRDYDEVVYLPTDHGRLLSDLKMHELDCADEVWVVNFCYSMDDMLKIIEMVGPQSVFWIDHSNTAIEAQAKICNRIGGDLPGIRKVGSAGCALAWRFCNPGEQAPWAVDFIADRDLKHFHHGDMTRWFYEIYINEEETTPGSDYWDRLFSMSLEAIHTMATDRGKPLYEARIRALRSTVRRLGREVVLHLGNNGNARPVKALKINHIPSGDLGQVIKELGYAVAWCYVEFRFGVGVVRENALYTDAEDIDVSVYARAHGGGGCNGAAGFVETVGVEAPAT